MIESHDGFYVPQQADSKSNRAKIGQSSKLLISVTAGLLLLGLIASAMVAALLIVESESELKRRVLAASVPTWTRVASINAADMNSTNPFPTGYLRGKCVLIDYNPLRGDGTLHPWHPIDDESGLFASSSDEVETALCLVRTEELVSQYEYGEALSKKTEVLTVFVVDLVERRVVGNWRLTGNQYRVEDSSDFTEISALSAQQVLNSIAQLPVKARVQDAIVPS